MTGPLVLPRSEHPMSRADIEDNALGVLHRLVANGHSAYLVGGSVRDLLLGRTPKDFDVGTDARPSKIKKIFRNSRIVGRRFRIAHVYFSDGGIIEVATFRRGSQETILTPKGKTILRDNEYGTPEEDARRRDLTINGLFYDIKTFSVIDYVGGVEDLREGVVRTINDPDVSFAEDPVRIIRTQRHAARLGFAIEEATWESLLRNRQRIIEANPSRLLEETLKDLRSGSATSYYQSIQRSEVLDYLLPPLARQLNQEGERHPLWRRLAALDERTQAGASYSSPTLLALLLHTVLLPTPKHWEAAISNPSDAWQKMQDPLQAVTVAIQISRRDIERMFQVVMAYRKIMLSVDAEKLQRNLRGKAYLAEALDFAEIDLLSRGLPTDRILAWRSTSSPPAVRERASDAARRDRDDRPTRRRGRRRRPRRPKAPEA